MTEGKQAGQTPDVERRLRDGSFLGRSRMRDDLGKTVRIRVQRVVKKRVLRMGEKGRRHGSEAFEATGVTSKNIEITREVIEGVTSGHLQKAATDAPQHQVVPEPGAFTCGHCGAAVPVGSDRCPACDTLFLNDISDEELKALEEAERAVQTELSPDSAQIVEKAKAPCVHFDARTGSINYLQIDSDPPNISIECGNCGTEIAFDAERCPICGCRLEGSKAGIAGLFTGMEFDKVEFGQMNCPMCGELVTVKDGSCPVCHEQVACNDAEGSCERLDPIIHTDNVVFLHLDVSSGEVNYLQKITRDRALSQTTVRLEEIGRSGFDRDWKSLSRV